VTFQGDVFTAITESSVTENQRISTKFEISQVIITTYITKYELHVFDYE